MTPPPLLSILRIDESAFGGFFPSGFSQAKVLVVGDLILDEFIWGKVSALRKRKPLEVALS